LRVIGVDPGLRHTGWGVVEFKNNKIFHIEDGSISPSTKLDDGKRLLEIKNQLQKIINQFNPNMSVIEKTFVGSGSVSSLKLGMARGASMIALAEAGLSIKEISPKFVKKTVTGYGSASKEQIKSMIEKLLNIVPRNEDSADALAIAISGQNIDYDNNFVFLDKNNKLNMAINRALLKEQNK
tara:strand:+ start:61 stop:606 length:546 start_codon:yes stop_codon:yes gene_type:complete